MTLDKYVDELGRRLDVSASVIDDYEARVADLTERVGSLAADLLEEQAQRREVAAALVRVTEERDGWKQAVEELRNLLDEYMRERAVEKSGLYFQRDEARAERDQLVVDLGQANDTAAGLANRIDELLAERDEARDEVVRLGRELDETRRERDLAMAHDTQPYPTADAYERACAALHRTKAENVRLRTIIVELGAGEAAEPPTDEVEAMLRRASDQMLADLERTVDVEADLAALKERAKEWRPMTDDEIEALRPGGAGFDEWLLGQPGGSE